MEALDFDNLTKERRKAIAQTIRPIDVPELKKLGEEIFKYTDDAWRDLYFGFINEHPGASFHHATTSDSVHLLYCRDEDKGIWFLPGVGKGPLQESGKRLMKELIEGSTH